MVRGSPLNALLVQPPFKEYHLIDLNGDKVDLLESRVGTRNDVYFYKGDCNHVLLEDVFPLVRFQDYRRDSESGVDEVVGALYKFPNP